MEGIVHVRGGRLSEQQVAEMNGAHSDDAADSRIQDGWEQRQGWGHNFRPNLQSLKINFRSWQYSDKH